MRGTRKITLSSSLTGWVNTWDETLDWTAGSNRMITGCYSEHHNHREDRVWKFYSAAVNGVTCKYTGLHGYANGWDNPLTFVCPDNQALKKVYSHHDNGREDRKWRFGCCAVSSNVYLKRGGWTNYLNDWDSPLNFRCKDTEVLVGLKSYHDNHREDRRWYFYCSEILRKRVE